MDKLFDLFGTTDTVKGVIHSDAPTVATDGELADLTKVTGNGYTAGGKDIQNDATRSGGTVTMTAVDVVWTVGASDGSRDAMSQSMTTRRPPTASSRPGTTAPTSRCWSAKLLRSTLEPLF